MDWYYFWMIKIQKKSPLLKLRSVGPSTVEDFKLIGITKISQLIGKNPNSLYDELCRISGVKHNPCVLAVFCAAVAQAENPSLPKEKKNWWYWSRLSKKNKIS